MIGLEIKNKKNGAELNLRCSEYFSGVKTFYITKKQSKSAEDVVDLLSRFDNDEIAFLRKGKTEPASIERVPKLYINFWESRNVVIIRLLVGDTIFYFSLGKSPHNVRDDEDPVMYFILFRKMSYEPYVC